MSIQIVFKLRKAIYRLHQAHRAWYDTKNLSYCKWFKIGAINSTLFVKSHNNKILLIQMYIDDIIFSSTNKTLC